MLTSFSKVYRSPNQLTMKKKSTENRLSLDKETIAHLNFEQLSPEQANEIQGGATRFTAGASCCAEDSTYTSCSH